MQILIVFICMRQGPGPNCLVGIRLHRGPESIKIVQNLQPLPVGGFLRLQCLIYGFWGRQIQWKWFQISARTIRLIFSRVRALFSLFQFVFASKEQILTFLVSNIGFWGSRNPIEMVLSQCAHYKIDIFARARFIFIF